MWKSVNLKSFLIGGMMAVLVLCAMGSRARETVIVGRQVHGRFTIVAQTYDALILDTATGEVWTRNGGKHETFYDPKIVLSEPNDFDS